MVKYYEEYNTKEITELLMFRKVIKVKNNTLFLDNGVKLEIFPNEGCGGCSSGWYEIIELNGCDNIITNVEFDEDSETLYPDDDKSYKIFVYAENKKIKLLQVDGTDGNGYYGTGYTIKVKIGE